MLQKQTINLTDYEDILNSTKEGFWIVDLDGNILEVNSSYCELSGYTREELLQMHVKDVEIQQSPQEIQEMIQKIISEGSGIFETTHKTKQNQLLDLEIFVTFSSSNQYFITFLRDISGSKKIKQELESKKESLKKAQEIAHIGHWELDMESGKLKWSDEIYRIFGLEVGEVEASYGSFLNFIHPDDQDMIKETFLRSVKTLSSYKIVHRIITKNGEIRYVEELCEHYTNENHEIIKSIGTVQDITKKIETEQSLKLSAEVFNHSRDAILISDHNNNILTVNKAFEKQTGYTKAEIIGSNPRVLSSGWGDKKFYKQLWESLLRDEIWHGEIWDKRKNGELFIASQTIIVLKNDHGEITNYIGIATDVTNLYKEQEEKEKALTTSRESGLRNRYAFFEELKQEQSSTAALLKINELNKLSIFYGNEIVDKLLLQISETLQDQCSNDYNLYHFDRDTFIVHSKNLDEKIIEFSFKINNFLEKISKRIFVIDEIEMNLNLTAGVWSGESKELIKNLDMALLYAQQNNYSFWLHNELSDQTKHIANNIYWVKELKSALEEKRIVVYFQAIYAFESNSIERFEALVRLRLQDGSIATPNYFLEIAEEANLMSKITQEVFLQTIEMFKKHPNYKFSINISTKDIQNDEFRDLVRSSFEDRLLASKICFEILETHEVDDLKGYESFSNEIHQLGALTAIDDFGSGYANFENLIRLHTDIIKIDGSLIEKLPDNDGAYDIVASIVSFAKKRAIKTIAEFVKNKEIFSRVQQLGIDYVQGYYIGKPLEKLTLTTNIDQVSKNKYKMLAYVSKASQKTNYAMASEILNKSWDNNRSNSIGGVLLYDEEYFVQIINGEEDKIDQTYQRILKDSRHNQIHLIGETYSDRLEFQEWNMGYLPQSQSVNEIFKKHKLTPRKGLYTAPFENVKNLLKELTNVI